ncbi:hypothetical protein [Magnetofaba australis]|uniref:Uncharacterized protein n=1 Tax=Magnetofaba australis IT-1 TaxID=1434232 RepID=A0A1Y2K8J2_9PROT|nr:hypothetical protein [Magnetofaba australis]OSM06756.1 hypothetical protein MAIT1_00387 [Magnetofaba australis IT-1]
MSDDRFHKWELREELQGPPIVGDAQTPGYAAGNVASFLEQALGYAAVRGEGLFLSPDALEGMRLILCRAAEDAYTAQSRASEANQRLAQSDEINRMLMRQHLQQTADPTPPDNVAPLRSPTP